MKDSGQHENLSTREGTQPRAGGVQRLLWGVGFTWMRQQVGSGLLEGSKATSRPNQNSVQLRYKSNEKDWYFGP